MFGVAAEGNKREMTVKGDGSINNTTIRDTTNAFAPNQ
jgi:hypothetical protein